MMVRRRVRLVSVVGLLFTLMVAAPSVAAGPEVSRDTLFVPGEVLVKMRATSARMSGTVAQLMGDKVGGRVAAVAGDLALISAAPDADVSGLVRTLSAQPEVQYAQPNYIYWLPEENPRGKALTKIEVSRTVAGKEIKIGTRDLLRMRTKVGKQILGTYPGDTGWDWGFWTTFNNIIWSDTAPSPPVCVVDTGVDAQHPDLAGNVLPGFDFVNNDFNADDDNGHGTHVSGIIGAKINNITVPAWANARSGLSRSKIIPVKVMTAQGWGTSFWIGKGLRYCADIPSVKVINISLGGFDGDLQYEYDSLAYATGKGKLIVAAAGNDSSNSYFFPAAWSDPTVDQPSGDPNTIADRILAVGAMTNNQTWVDLDGDGVQTDNEILYNCAAYFSNFGSWVEIVGPGEDIISTTPYNKPFYENFFHGATSSSDWWSGTSMAAPFVTAAAARAWSVWPTLTATQIKAKLLASGDFLNIAEDPNRAGGFWDGGYQGDMPFCWPQEMQTNSRSVNFAKLMEREALCGTLEDSTTGLPLMGSTIQVFQGPLLKRTIAMPYPDGRWWDAINLPRNTTFTITANKLGYTSGAVTLGTAQTRDVGLFSTNNPIMTAIPPATKNFAVVATSPYAITSAPVLSNVAAQALPSFGADFDLYAWLPSATPGIVGPPLPLAAAYQEWVGPGALFDAPWAVYTRDGGFLDWLMVETLTVASRPGVPTAPYYPGDYNFFLYNWSESNCDQDNDTTLDSACMPPFTYRVWRNGLIKDQYSTWNLLGDYGHCAPDQFWYQPYRISATGVITRIDQCGNESILPYGTP